MRKKVFMRAPEGVTESQIEGTYYWPDEDGLVEVTNENHVAILQRHGYAKDSEVDIMPPAQAFGLIDTEELGRSQLIVALRQRGVSVDDSAPRETLVEQAIAWNAARRARPAGAPARAAAPAPAPAPVEPTTTESTQGPSSEPQAQDNQNAEASDKAPDFSSASYDELKAYCAARGVEFKGNISKKELRALAEAKAAEIAAQRKAA